MDDKKNKKARRAAAISYNPEKAPIPILSAYGEGHVADKIIETALGAGVPVEKDADMVSMLAKMSVGDEIPPELYQVVARLLVFVSQMDESYGGRYAKSPRP